MWIEASRKESDIQDELEDTPNLIRLVFVYGVFEFEDECGKVAIALIEYADGHLPTSMEADLPERMEMLFTQIVERRNNTFLALIQTIEGVLGVLNESSKKCPKWADCDVPALIMGRFILKVQAQGVWPYDTMCKLPAADACRKIDDIADSAAISHVHKQYHVGCHAEHREESRKIVQRMIWRSEILMQVIEEDIEVMLKRDEHGDIKGLLR